MATITSNGTGGGDWGTGATWVGGAVPDDDKNVVIAAGDTVTFNVDQSGFANGIDGITVTGTLKLSRTTSGYLKIKAAKQIDGAGTFDCGTDGDAIPFAVKHTITGGANWYVNGTSGLTMTVYAAEPSIGTVLLSADEAAGQTVLSVDTDVTGDIWAEGDTIIIANIANGRNPESRVIAAKGIAAGELTVTAGLTGSKLKGALVHLATRNVRFIANGTMLKEFLNGKLTIAGGEFTVISGYITQNCAGSRISGGIFHTGTYFIYNSIGTSVSGGIFTNGNYGLGGGCYGSTVSGGTFSGLTWAVMGAFYDISGGLITGCAAGVANVSGQIKNAILRYNTCDIYYSKITAFNTLFGSGTENSGYTALQKEMYSESIDHDQTVGAFKAWTKGGVTSSATATPPTGYTQYNNTVLENASVEGFWQKEVLVAAGASVEIESWLRKSASMTYLPRVIIFRKNDTDPFAGGAGEHTFTMTNSTDTWEDDTWTYSNNTGGDVTLVIRIQGMNASGNMLSAISANVINVDLTSTLANIAIVDTVVDAIKAKTDTLKNASLLVDGEIIV